MNNISLAIASLLAGALVFGHWNAGRDAENKLLLVFGGLFIGARAYRLLEDRT